MRAFLAAHWFVIVLALGVTSALLFPGPLHVVLDPWEPRSTVAVSLFLVAWTMPTRSLFAEAKRPWAALWAVFLSYGWLPLCAWLLGRIAPSPDVHIGLILVSSVPCTLSAAILWTRLAGGNEATALMTVLGTTFSSWGLTTVWLYYLTGADVDLNVGAMMYDLLVSLILPVVVGQLLRRVPPGRAFADRHKVLLATLAQCFVVAMVLKAGVLVGDKLHGETAAQAPMIVVWSLGTAIFLHLWALACGWFTSGWLRFERDRQIAVAFSASQKTLQVSLILFNEHYAEHYPFAIMPILFYHVGQLLLDTAIARQIAKVEPVPPPDPLDAGA